MIKISKFVRKSFIFDFNFTNFKTLVGLEEDDIFGPNKRPFKLRIKAPAKVVVVQGQNDQYMVSLF